MKIIDLLTKEEFAHLVLWLSHEQKGPNSYGQQIRITKQFTPTIENGITVEITSIDNDPRGIYKVGIELGNFRSNKALKPQ